MQTTTQPSIVLQERLQSGFKLEVRVRWLEAQTFQLVKMEPVGYNRLVNVLVKHA